jgi:hypothetical protein
MVICLLAAALLTGFGLAAQAVADGDPASDVLLGQSVFYPYSPSVSASLQNSLNAETTAAARVGFPLKVALIASPVDLGVIPDLFNKPQQYANFLDQEISLRTKQPLLVVMPAGYGVAGMSSNATSALSSLAKPSGQASNDLAQAATAAVPKIAKAEGHQVAAASSPGGTNVLLIVLVVAAALTSGALAALTLWRRQAAV